MELGHRVWSVKDVKYDKDSLMMRLHIGTTGKCGTKGQLQLFGTPYCELCQLVFTHFEGPHQF